MSLPPLPAAALAAALVLLPGAALAQPLSQPLGQPTEAAAHRSQAAAEAAREGLRTAADLLAQMDVAAITAAAMADLAPLVQRMTADRAGTRLDPDQMVTYGLIAQYGVDLAMDALDEAQGALTPAIDPTPCAA